MWDIRREPWGTVSDLFASCGRMFVGRQSDAITIHADSAEHKRIW